MYRLNVNLNKDEEEFIKSRPLSVSEWIRWVINEGIRLEKQSKVSASASITEEKE